MTILCLAGLVLAALATRASRDTGGPAMVVGALAFNLIWSLVMFAWIGLAREGNWLGRRSVGRGFHGVFMAISSALLLLAVLLGKNGAAELLVALVVLAGSSLCGAIWMTALGRANTVKPTP